MQNNNVYNVSNPMCIMDALWDIIEPYHDDFTRVLIFLPSQRAIRSFTKKIVDKMGRAVILPMLVPLGTGVENEDVDEEEVLSGQERVVSLTGVLAKNSLIKTVSSALQMSHDFIRMQDYLENEGKKIEDINWDDIFNNVEYDAFSKGKKELLKILTDDFIKKSTIKTTTQKRNEEILGWKDKLKDYDRVIVCGSTASVPVTANLMSAIAQSDNGMIILSGKIPVNQDEEYLNLDTHPYYAEYKFLKSIGLSPKDVQTIQMKENDEYIDILNSAFSNDGSERQVDKKLNNFTLVECNRESQEAAVAVRIAKNVLDENLRNNEKKSVLIITPDAAANQRIKAEIERVNAELQQNNPLGQEIKADFSVGIPGTMTDLGRSLLNLFDDWIEDLDSPFDTLIKKHNYNIYNMLIDFIDNRQSIEKYKDYEFRPGFDIENKEDIPLWQSIEMMSKNLQEIPARWAAFENKFTIYDARAFLADAIGAVSIRQGDTKDCQLSILGTIESRMQTADVVILTGLNEGMFPSIGYENSWLPRHIAENIGFPSPNKKVSLMALDFINLSCAQMVYWLRTVQSGGAKNLESRFISRVRVVNGDIEANNDLLNEVDKRDDIKYNPLECSANEIKAIPRDIDTSPVYATEFDYLMNNPYAFYVKHILRLNPKDEYWALPDQRLFGDIVHKVIEDSKDMNAESLVDVMEKLAEDVKSKYPLIFYFWQARFREIAKFAEAKAKDIIPTIKEKTGEIEIAGRLVKAKADVIWNSGVLDIKTGEAPSEKDLLAGNAPQVPIEGYILMNDGFEVKMKDKTNPPLLKFLQLKKNKEKVITFEGAIASAMIEITFDKIKDLLEKYSVQGAEYKYEITGSDLYNKYGQYDDFARKDD